MSTSTPAETRSRIQEILRDSVHWALGLKETLDQEREALEQRDIDALNQVAMTKEVLIRKLANLEVARAAASEEAGFGSSPAEMESLTEWCDKDLSTTNSWKNFREIANECDARNRTNGAIIRLRRQQIIDGLSLLRGDEHDSSTYTSTGSASSEIGGRALTEA